MEQAPLFGRAWCPLEDMRQDEWRTLLFDRLPQVNRLMLCAVYYLLCTVLLCTMLLFTVYYCSLSHTHTHPHTHPPSLPLSLPLPLPLHLLLPHPLSSFDRLPPPAAFRPRRLLLHQSITQSWPRQSAGPITSPRHHRRPRRGK